MLLLDWVVRQLLPKAYLTTFYAAIKTSKYSFKLDLYLINNTDARPTWNENSFFKRFERKKPK